MDSLSAANSGVSLGLFLRNRSHGLTEFDMSIDHF